MDFTPITTNPGYGGAIFATDSFVQGSTTFVMPFTALAISSDGGVTYTPVGEGGLALPIDITKIGGTSFTLGPVGLSSSISTIVPRASTRTVTSVTASLTSVQVLAANSNRLGASIYNDSTAYMYLKAGTGASSSSKTLTLAPKTFYELLPCDNLEYTAAWSSATGSADITEWGN